MKKLFLFVVILLVAFIVYWFMLRSKDSRPEEPKQEPITLKKHSDSFNLAVDRMTTAYLSAKDAFVDADTAAVKSHIRSFISFLDSIPYKELEKDAGEVMQTAMAGAADVKANAESLLKQTDITEMRKDFSMVTEMLYPGFFKSINYEGQKLYLQHCPMAFDGDKGANWISNSDEVINPYLGKNHPKYKGSMLNCGEVMDTIKAL